ncbi:MAG: FAD-binding oxidoreductase [Alphaproteobacteria bacterium]|jgi:FAD/FMN-containing dehydrogenase|nr:FAD-binding oxidoreductase [Alphaproteobacteria bacterium]MBT4086081.1 FAD-binding oxidoreductase [Alphaproteobacteria bacterium]MBT4543698.1 FAD-binding oxidoreductase [Alphaproteobacteria bacterium]MBT7743943.1 FAD-binding oxidoreductase [Alphaproteobacteria bacterium]
MDTTRNFSPPSAEAIDRLKAAVGPGGWTEDQEEIAPWVREDRGLWFGSATLMLKPANTDEVSQILRICNETDTCLVPQGGNTSLVGASIPIEGQHEIVLSLRRLNRIRDIDPLSNTIIVEAGCILADIQDAADEVERLFPLSLGSQGSCRIGGNLSTNAGGTGVLKYGNTRDLALGLEVVLPNGDIINDLKTLRKDNTGYSVKNLFIGAEGTLGVITAASLKLFPKPGDVLTGFVAIPHVAAAIDLLSRARQAVGDTVTAFELIPRIGIDFLCKHIEGSRDPLENQYEWYALIEISAPGKDVDLRTAFENMLEAAYNDDVLEDAVIAGSAAQASQLWRMRESLNEAQKPEGASIKHDVSVPITEIPQLIAEGSEAISAMIEDVRVLAFGHVGDGNVHFNFSRPLTMKDADFMAQAEKIHHIIHDIVHKLGGSISAEHGLGRHKREEIKRFKDPASLELMSKIKDLIDPNGIMNPGKVI